MAWQSRMTDDLARFIGTQDHFYFGTASAKGAPYIQHRGGPKGFLRVTGENRLGFADFAGNAQYVSLRHMEENPQAFIFLIDYPSRTRIKIRGHAQPVTDPEEIRPLAVPGYRARVERGIRFDIKEWDLNCKAHILPRWDSETLSPAFDRLETRIHELEAMVRELGGDPGDFEIPR